MSTIAAQHSTSIRPFVPDPFGWKCRQSPADTPERSRSTCAGGDDSSPPCIEFEELLPFMQDDSVTDVLAIGDSGIWIDRGCGLERTSVVLDEPRVRELAVALVASGGRHVDETTPIADVRLGDGLRVHVVLKPISVRGTAISVRVPASTRIDLEGLETRGFFTVVPRAVVDMAVHSRRNVLVSGATGAGKTTLLGAFLGAVPHDERIVLVEDVAELRVNHPHVVSLEARQPNAEGAGRIELDTLVRAALRMRPDRIVLGECRGGEVRELMSALNTGHDGGAGTLHANSLGDVPARLEALGMLAGLQPDAVCTQAVSAFGVVMHVDCSAGVRRLAAVGTLVARAGRLRIQERQ